MTDRAPTVPDLFRAWWKESYPTTPPNPRTVDSHVAFAERVTLARV